MRNIRMVNNGYKDYYVYDMPIPSSRRTKRIYADTEKELLEKIEKAEAEMLIRNKYSAPQDDANLQEFIKYYFKCNMIDYCPSVLKKNLNLMQNVVYGSEIDIPINELDEKKINSFYSKLSQTYKNTVILDIGICLERTITFACELEKCKPLDFDSIILPVKGRDPNNYILSKEQYYDFLRFIIEESGDKYGINREVVIVQMMTGFTTIAIIALTKSDVDFKNKKITFRRNGQSSVVDMPDELALRLKNIIKNDKTGDKKIFWTNKGAPTVANVNTTINYLTKKYGLPCTVTSLSLQKAYIIMKYEEGESILSLSNRFLKQPRRLERIISENQITKRLLPE